MNYINHLRLFYDTIKNDQTLSAVHISLYLALFQKWNFNHFKNHIEKGVSPHEIAILYRNNKDAFAFAELAQIIGVPFTIESDLDLFSERDIKKTLLILRALREHEHGVSLSYVLHLDIFKLPALDVYRVIREADNLKRYGSDKRVGLWEIISDKKLMLDAGVVEINKFLDFAKLFTNLWETGGSGLIYIFIALALVSGFLSTNITYVSSEKRYKKIMKRENIQAN